MRLRLSVPLLLIGMALNTAVRAEAPKVTLNTRQLVDQFGADLAQAWVDFPKDSQKTVRDIKISDLNGAFNRDMLKAENPANLTVQKALESCVADVAKAKTLLKLDTMTQDRTTYVNACLAALRREIPITSDYKSARTTQQCYELMLDMCTLAREKLHTFSQDAQQQTYSGISMAIADLVRGATIPEKPDPTTQLDLNIKEARKRFPMTTPELEQANRSVVSLLESTAKTIQQKNK